MNFVARKRRILVDTGFSEYELSLYNNDLQMYSTAPDSKLTLKEFEEQALERVKVLRIIEQTSAKGKECCLACYKFCFCLMKERKTKRDYRESELSCHWLKKSDYTPKSSLAGKL